MGKLREARESLGFSVDEVAAEAGWSKHRLDALERTDEPDVLEGRTLGDLYGIDIDALLDEDHPTPMPVSALLRAQHADVSAHTRFAITAAASVARDARRIQGLLGRDTGWAAVEGFRHRPEDDDPAVAEDLAKDVRNRLSLGPNKAIGSVSRLAGRLGTLLLWTNLDREIDAVSMATQDLGAVIVANAAGHHMQTGCHRRVTLAHELCHVLFDRPRMAGLEHFCVTGGNDDETAKHRDNLERRARAFPAYLLASRTAVERIWRGTGSPADKVASVMETFGIGYEATRHHLHFLGLLNLDERLGQTLASPSKWDAADAIPDPRRNTVLQVALDAGVDPMRVALLVPLVGERDGIVDDAVAREVLRATPDQWDQIRRAAFGQSVRAWGTPSSAVDDDDETAGH